MSTVIVEHQPEVIEADVKTDQDFIDEGKALVKQAELTGRELGYWYNELKMSREEVSKVGNDAKSPQFLRAETGNRSAKEICDEVGISYSHASQMGQFVKIFPSVASQQGFSQRKCMFLAPAHKELGEAEFHGRFMSDAKAGVPYNSDPEIGYIYTGPWSERDIRRQVKLVRGIDLPASSEVAKAVTVGLHNDVDETLKKAKIAAPVKTEVKKALKKAERELKGKFHDEVNAKVAELVTEQTAKVVKEAEEKIELGKENAKRYREKEKEATVRLKGLPAIISKAEYRYLLNTIHPDKFPHADDEQKAKLAKAFDIIKKLAAGVELT